MCVPVEKWKILIIVNLRLEASTVSLSSHRKSAVLINLHTHWRSEFSLSKRQQAFTASPVTAGAGDDLKDYSLILPFLQRCILQLLPVSEEHLQTPAAASEHTVLSWALRTCLLDCFFSSALSFIIPENVDDLRRECKCLNLNSPDQSSMVRHRWVHTHRYPGHYGFKTH